MPVHSENDFLIVLISLTAVAKLVLLECCITAPYRYRIDWLTVLLLLLYTQFVERNSRMYMRIRATWWH